MAYDGNYRLGELFNNRRERGKPGLPTLSVTLNNGLVDRTSLERKTETTLSDEQHLLVRKGDIVYNTMRMWQGASGLATKDGLVSPAYVVLAPKAGIDPRYASYLFKTKRMIYLFWAYSHELTSDRLRLYFEDACLIPLRLPPMEHQAMRTDGLGAIEGAIRIIERLQVSSKKLSRALCQQLLVGVQGAPISDGEWKTCLISSVSEVLVSTVDKKYAPEERPVRLCNYTDVYKNSRITDDMNFSPGTCTSRELKKFLVKQGDVLITKDSESPGDIAVPTFVADKLTNVVCGYHLAIIRPDGEVLDGHFLSLLLSLPRTKHYFRTRANGATRFGLPVDCIKNAMICIPSLREQRRISRIFTLLANEDAKLEAFKRMLGSLASSALHSFPQGSISQPSPGVG